MARKLKIGWFSFTCCEDSTIVFVELLNTHYQQWLPKIDFVHGRIFRKDATEEIKQMDVAFIEGAISSNRQEEKLKKIRQKAKILIAVGSCAVLGSPSNQRNFFDQTKLEEIKPILEKFKYKEKVLKISEVVQVDEEIPGCPMDEEMFLKILNKCLGL
jgi:coenzyme F420-reducing hydrogenase gamma subunit